MKEQLKKPDYLFDVSWEVCNMVGGIYTVLSTQAATLQAQLGDGLIYIGPDLGYDSPSFDPTAPTTLESWQQKAIADGLKVKVGRWKIPGSPQVVLIDFRPFYTIKNTLYGQMWEWYGVNSIAAYGDYDEGCIFAYAAANVIESLYKHICPQRSNSVALFNEWTTGMGLLYLKKQLPSIATIFTTHATCIGRSIAGNGKPLYDYMQGYNGDQMADELNMTSKHSVEKTAAQQADCFTTVSDITASECRQLLCRIPLVTPNGFESDFVPKGVAFSRQRKESRALLVKLANCLTGNTIQEDALFISTAGRCEYKNKGLDIFLDTINTLRHNYLNRQIVAFVMVPGWVQEPRADLVARMKSGETFDTPLGDPVFTHALNNYNEDAILNYIHRLGMQNKESDNVKIIYIPSYLTGNDGILNRHYYNLLSAMDASIFASYYEPWGYTPLESCAFGVPTITTSLSGFGKWCLSIGKDADILDGVAVISRNDSNYGEVVNGIVKQITRLAELPSPETKILRQEIRKVAAKAEWRNFIKYYNSAFDFAIKAANNRRR